MNRRLNTGLKGLAEGSDFIVSFTTSFKRPLALRGYCLINGDW
jgi:hypothetical protein